MKVFDFSITIGIGLAKELTIFERLDAARSQRAQKRNNLRTGRSSEELQAQDDKVIIDNLDYLEVDYIRKNLELNDIIQQQTVRWLMIESMYANFYPEILEREIQMLQVLVLIKQHQKKSW